MHTTKHVKRFSRWALAGGLWLALWGGGGVRADEDPVDFERARRYFQKRQQGGTLTPEEEAYVRRAMAERRRRQQLPQAGRAAGAQAGPGERIEAWTGHATPLPELGTGTYRGEDGGLYGGGRNVPPPAHFAAAQRAAEQVVPRDAAGQPAAEGRIGLLSVGMSNTTMEFSRFMALARNDPERAPAVVLVDGAQGGQAGAQWTDPRAAVWARLDERVRAAGLAAPQVQVVWLKQAEMGPARLGEFPAHARVLQANVTKALRQLRERFPNLRLVYLSSRIYAGYATTRLNPEPYAYEGAFAMRWVIQAQIAGQPDLNYDPSRGPVVAPLVLWGPYLWADGATPRAADGLQYRREDVSPADGTHPSDSGRLKVAEQLQRFFRTEPTARVWYLRAAGTR